MMAQSAPAASTRPALPYRPFLHAYAVILVVATFILIAIGGEVTSRGAGLAVPDWPGTFGHNMFTAPFEQWAQGGAFWEHSHRLKGSLVGFLTLGLAFWLRAVQWRKPILAWLLLLAIGAFVLLFWITANQFLSPAAAAAPLLILLIAAAIYWFRPSQWQRPWLCWFSLALLALVVAQGLMGGFRVTEISTTLALIHGVTGQVFLALTVLAAAATSRPWLAAAASPSPSALPSPARIARYLSLLLLAVLLTQLILGAAVRHLGAGLAIPDFPSSYGSLIPPFTQQGINAARMNLPPELMTIAYTVKQVAIHFTHRVWALVVIAAAVWLITSLSKLEPKPRWISGPVASLILLLIIQISLGVLVIWTARNPPVTATAHQAVGAALLAVATLLSIRVHLATRAPEAAPAAQAQPQPDTAAPPIPGLNA
jgi:cytochrome c oxidase assembly protein subunit 15